MDKNKDRFRTVGKMNKKLLDNLRALSDKELWEVLKIFDFCQECWDPYPEKCELRPIRKKIGLGECKLFKLTERLEKRIEVRQNRTITEVK